MDKSRTELLVGSEGLDKLAAARIAVVGTGGVGGYAAVMLARAGAERLSLIDFDKVTPSNINRQVVAFEDTVGKFKVDLLADMIGRINQNAIVHTFCERLTKDNMDKLLQNCDIIVDAIDSIADKVDLIEYATTNCRYIISAMGAGNRCDIPQFIKTDIFKTHDDGLAKVVRKKLRERGIKKLDVVTSTSPALPTGQRTIGSISYYPASCGCIIAAAVVEHLLKN